MSANDDRSRALAALFAIIVIILLLLWGRDNGDHTTIVNQGGDLELGGVTLNQLPAPGPLTLPRVPGGGRFDWTTDIGCLCNTNFKPQVYVPPPVPQPRRSPAFVFAFTPPPLPPPSLPIYLPAPPAIPVPAVQAVQRTFSWGWDGPQRIVRLSNGLQLYAGLDKREFQLLDDGSIIYNTLRYYRV